MSHVPVSLPVLRLEGVACRRGERRLFEGLDATIEPGALAWVRGANGRGKTSLLRLVAGLAVPDAGAVLWDGRPVRGDAAYAAGLAWIGHANALKDDLSALENLAFLARVHGHAHGEAVLRGALARLGLGGRERVPARSLSQGLRRRVALARLVLAPAGGTWILDEPFDALDAAGIAALQALLAGHRAGGGRVLLTAHQWPAAEAPAPAQVLDLDVLAVPTRRPADAVAA